MGLDEIRRLSNDKGFHTLIIGYREDGACLDKLCITNDEVAPSGMGEADPVMLGINSIKKIDGYALGQNYPNPFNPVTNIFFNIPSRSFVSLIIFDLLGREVAALVFERLSAGDHLRRWNAVGLSSGIYLYRLQSGSFTDTKKLVLLK
jgi:hypothetical protein